MTGSFRGRLCWYQVARIISNNGRIFLRGESGFLPVSKNTCSFSISYFVKSNNRVTLSTSINCHYWIRLTSKPDSFIHFHSDVQWRTSLLTMW